MKRLVFGVGVNDSDQPVSKRVNGRQVFCGFYIKWKTMLMRCYDKRVHSNFPSYAECEVCDEWKLFSNFREWMMSQDWDGKELDKDILVPGNKIYSPMTCIFVPREVNAFIIERDGGRGHFPIGVYFNKEKGRYQAYCKNPFTKRQEHLGRFDCPTVAHEAWRRRKHELACQLADSVDDDRISIALRNRYKER